MLTVHVLASVGWMGAVGGFLTLAALGLTGSERHVVQAATLMLEPLARLVILPLALTALLSGIVQALGTPWGLVRHYWVLAKLVLTAVATAVLFRQLGRISELADAASDPWWDAGGLYDTRLSMVVHASGGLLVLLLILVLSVYKPRGTTPFGMRPPARRLP